MVQVPPLQVVVQVGPGNQMVVQLLPSHVVVPVCAYAAPSRNNVRVPASSAGIMVFIGFLPIVSI